MNNKRINRETAVEIIKSGKFCTVQFATRTGNALRKMNGRTGVKSALRGGVAPYKASEKNLIIFYENNREGYKSIPIERILVVNGKTVV